jgi:hypothetical protein
MTSSKGWESEGHLGRTRETECKILTRGGQWERDRRDGKRLSRGGGGGGERDKFEGASNTCKEGPGETEGDRKTGRWNKKKECHGERGRDGQRRGRAEGKRELERRMGREWEWENRVKGWERQVEGKIKGTKWERDISGKEERRTHRTRRGAQEDIFFRIWDVR